MAEREATTGVQRSADERQGGISEEPGSTKEDIQIRLRVVNRRIEAVKNAPFGLDKMLGISSAGILLVIVEEMRRCLYVDLNDLPPNREPLTKILYELEKDLWEIPSSRESHMTLDKKWMSEFLHKVVEYLENRHPYTKNQLIINETNGRPEYYEPLQHNRTVWTINGLGKNVKDWDLAAIWKGGRHCSDLFCWYMQGADAAKTKEEVMCMETQMIRGAAKLGEKERAEYVNFDCLRNKPRKVPKDAATMKFQNFNA